MKNHFISESNEAYHARPEISASKIKTMDRGWRIWEGSEITRTIKRTESPSIKLGTAIHAAILEPAEFAKTYVMCPPECSDRRTKAYKAWEATVCDEQIVLTSDEMSTVFSCAAAAMANPVAAGIIAAASTVEKSFLFTDEKSGVPCRVRFDMLASSVVCDIKSIASLNDGDFAKAVQDYRYDVQAAHYLEGFRTINGNTDFRFVFLVLETAAPYRCRVYQLGSGEIEAGYKRRDDLLAEYARRKESGDWSDPGENELQTVYFSDWFYKREMAR